MSRHQDNSGRLQGPDDTAMVLQMRKALKVSLKFLASQPPTLEVKRIKREIEDAISESQGYET